MRISTLNSKKYKALGILLWLFVWEIVYLIINKEIYLPSPFSVLISLVNIIKSSDFPKIVFYTTYRVMLSFIISIFLGFFTGLLCGINRKAYDIFEPLIILIRSTPVISVIILAIIWLKSSYSPVLTGVLMCYPIIWTNVVHGIRKTDRKLIEMCNIYKITPFQILKHLYFPSALPFIFSGLSTSLGIAWKVVAAAEVLSLPKYGIGSKLHDSKAYLEIPNLFAWTAIIIILSFFFELIIVKIYNKSIAIKHNSE